MSLNQGGEDYVFSILAQVNLKVRGLLESIKLFTQH